MKIVWYRWNNNHHRYLTFSNLFLLFLKKWIFDSWLTTFGDLVCISWVWIHLLWFIEASAKWLSSNKQSANYNITHNLCESDSPLPSNLAVGLAYLSRKPWSIRHSDYPSDTTPYITNFTQAYSLFHQSFLWRDVTLIHSGHLIPDSFTDKWFHQQKWISCNFLFGISF